MRKKGFTLIELLAVIVILAIIALIATPMVLNTIDDAKKGAASSSASSYMSAVETSLTSYMLKNNGQSYATGKYNVAKLKSDLDVQLKGDAPTEGNVCIASNGIVSKASVKVNGYVVNYDGKETKTTDLKEVEDIDCVKSYSVGDVVTLSIGNDTTSQWNVIAVNGDSIKLLKSTILIFDGAPAYYDANHVPFYEYDEWNIDDKSSLSYENSYAKTVVDLYTASLNLGNNLVDSGLISINDLKNLGCDTDNNTCVGSHSWLYGAGWTSTVSKLMVQLLV